MSALGKEDREVRTGGETAKFEDSAQFHFFSRCLLPFYLLGVLPVCKIAALKDKVRSLEAQVEALALEAESRASTTAAVLAENEELRASRDDLLHKMTGGLLGGLGDDGGASTAQSTADAVRGYVPVLARLVSKMIFCC